MRDQWNYIKDLLPGRKEGVSVTALSKWCCIDIEQNIPWRELPDRFRDFRTIHLKHSRGSASGVWKKVFEVLGSVENLMG